MRMKSGRQCYQGLPIVGVYALPLLIFLIMSTVTHAGFSGNPTVVSDSATRHQAFVDCNDVVIQRITKKKTQNWEWLLVIYDGDNDALKNDVVFLGSRSKHLVGPDPPEQPNQPNNLVSLDLDAICDNAPRQQPRVPQHSQRDKIHQPLGHQDHVQIRADPVPGGGVGVRISIQLDHLIGQSPIPLEDPLTDPNGDDQEDSEGHGSHPGQDCDDDGLPDDIGIAIGVDGDADGDGIPNACDPPTTPWYFSWKLWASLFVFVLVLMVLITVKHRLN